MDLRTIVAIMFRNWTVVIPAAVLTAVLGYLAFSHVAPQYEAQASVLFLSPNPGSSNPSQATNPYNDFSGSLRTTAAALQNVMLDQQVRADLRANGLKGTYSVTLPIEGPILDLVIDSPSAESAIALQKAVIAEVSKQLQLSQDAVQAPADQRITDQVLDQSSTASRRVVNQNRALIALVIIGLGMTVAAAFLSENLTSPRRRKERRRKPPGPSPTPPVAEAAGDEPPTPLRVASDAPPERRRRWGRRAAVPEPVETASSEEPPVPPDEQVGEAPGPDANASIFDSTIDTGWAGERLRRNR